MRFNLKVPYAEKDQAKQLGARWDAARKVWYVDGRDDIEPFARWSPSEHSASSEAPPPAVGAAKAAKPATRSSASSAGGQVCVGSRYVAQPRVCDCAPWEECERCRVYALAG